MINDIKKFIKKRNKKFFLVSELEEYLFKNNSYASLGFKELAESLKILEKKQWIRPVKVSNYYYKRPPIKMKWRILSIEKNDGWPNTFFLQYGHLLDLTYFKKNLSKQTDRNVDYIKRIAAFMNNRDNRFESSVEERSLELFDDEKYLKRPNSIISKINLNPRLGYRNFEEALKMKKYSQMFVYFERENSKKERLLIVENQSTFFSLKRILEEEKKILNVPFDIIIWGQGKRIIKQLEMLEMIVSPSEVTIDYFGDMDPEGYFIFNKLQKRYFQLSLSLFAPAYEILVAMEKFYPYDTKQQKRQETLTLFLQAVEKPSIQTIIKKMWHENLRIPQELITYEVLKRRGN